MNHTVLVGRLVNDPKLTELENNRKVANFTIAVPRSYKNKDGEYEADFVDCEIWGGLAGTTSEYSKKGDLVGLEGRIETDIYKDKDGDSRKSVKMIGDKITFLSSKNKTEEKDNSTRKKSSDEKSR